MKRLPNVVPEFGRVFDKPIGMKKLYHFFFLFCALFTLYSQAQEAQEIKLKKGTITDSLAVAGSESYALYLPSYFDEKKEWPVLMVCDMKGRAIKAISMFINAAEEQGYVLVGSNNINDSISISSNVLITSRMLKKVAEVIPMDKERLYSAGFSAGARFASLTPSFIKDLKGVVSLGAALPNIELLSSKNSFHFVGIVGNEDYSYTDMLGARETLKRLNFPNQLWIFDGGLQWPSPELIEKALISINLYTMSKGSLPKNEKFIRENYQQELLKIEELLNESRFLNAYNYLNEIVGIYQRLTPVDSLLTLRKQLRKDKEYRAQRRDENASRFKETLIRDEYQYNLLEDISTLNYNNLGWWNYQVDELNKNAERTNKADQKMGLRVLTYLNALIEDNIDIESAEVPVNDEALSFLWMLKTITEPDNFDYYLKIISDSARYEDFGTALFYLEELLKRGYKDKEALYTLEHTALLRITPEFNELIREYLQDARYEIIEE